MAELLCQVCGEPADENDDGVLWLLQDHRADWQDWPNRMGCTEPPVCRDCAHESVRLRPALRKGRVLARVRDAPVTGVRGALYLPNALGVPRAVQHGAYGLAEPLIHSVLASLLVREIRDATLIDR
ncbi:hypothetical protein [Saccharothrix xinjiangensis]|uniref:HNH endonuclease n=1 Tax=Saccharothrix xinjiangensis TaxID=204798 RepID=A0ABV9YCZ1_9PSEU